MADFEYVAHDPRTANKLEDFHLARLDDHVKFSLRTRGGRKNSHLRSPICVILRPGDSMFDARTLVCGLRDHDAGVARIGRNPPGWVRNGSWRPLAPLSFLQTSVVIF